MPSYLVKWEVDIDADTPYEAAELARVMQLDPESEATCFDIIEDGQYSYFMDVGPVATDGELRDGKV